MLVLRYTFFGETSKVWNHDIHPQRNNLYQTKDAAADEIFLNL
jgi:hypothetical protein